MRNVEVMDPGVDVRGDRLTQRMKDEWGLMAGCSDTLTDRQSYSTRKSATKMFLYPIISHAIFFGQRAVVR